jgi:hypothetical protein
MRQAMKGILPDTVRHRRTKSEMTNTVYRALEASGGAQFFQNLAVEQLGWVDGDQVRSMYSKMARLFTTQDAAYRLRAWDIWMIMGIELWYREVFLDQKSP